MMDEKQREKQKEEVCVRQVLKHSRQTMVSNREFTQDKGSECSDVCEAPPKAANTVPEKNLKSFMLGLLPRAGFGKRSTITVFRQLA